MKLEKAEKERRAHTRFFKKADGLEKALAEMETPEYIKKWWKKEADCEQ